MLTGHCSRDITNKQPTKKCNSFTVSSLDTRTQVHNRQIILIKWQLNHWVTYRIAILGDTTAVGFTVQFFLNAIIIPRHVHFFKEIQLTKFANAIL